MRNTNPIDNSEDILDSRDINARIEYLQSLRDDFQAENESDDWELTDDGEELCKLEELAEDGKNNCSEWDDGTTLIRDSYFTDYAEELVKDIGDLPEDLPSYIENNIDWDGVASDIQMDYNSIDFDGITYWIRSC